VSVDRDELEPEVWDEPGTAEAIAWNPRPLLDAVFNGNAKVALAVCRNWAGGNEETLKSAVSAACIWGLSHDISGKPAKYIRTGLTKNLPEVAQRESLDTWVKAQKGQQCPACHGKGFDDGGPCQFCETTGILQKRRMVRRNKQAPLPHAEGEDGERELDDLIIIDPARARFDPDYQRSYVTATTPEMIVDSWPPPDTEHAVQLLVSGLLAQYMHAKVDTVTRRGLRYVHVDGLSWREAADQLTAEGHQITYEGLRGKVNGLLAMLRRLTPPEPERPRLHTSRDGFGGRIPIWQRNWFLDGLLIRPWPNGQ
jgi:hypothetical protein